MVNHATTINTQTSALVTGGAGFIGSHLVERLVELGAQVTVIDNLATGHVENLNTVRSRIKIVSGDVGDLLRIKQLNLSEYQLVFHLAANPYIPPSVENPAYDYRVNLENTFTLLECLRLMTNPPRLMNTSSAAVYGNPASLPIHENDPTVPISPYGASKLAAERYTAIYSQLYGIRANSVRLFSAYGPRQRKQVVFDILRKLRDNPKQIELFGDGTQARDFAHVEDVTQAMILAATVAPGYGEVYNVASGVSHSINQLVMAWCEVCNLSPRIMYTGHTRPGDAEKWEVNIDALQQIGYVPHVKLIAGLSTIRDWFDASF